MSKLAWCKAAAVAATAVVPIAVGSAPPALLPNLAVASRKIVSPVEYREASTFAASGSAPVDIALKVAGTFEGSMQHIIQVNNASEAPSASEITVIRDGLLDDSVRSERWEISLERRVPGIWEIKEVRRAWRCWRGAERERFVAVRCP